MKLVALWITYASAFVRRQLPLHSRVFRSVFSSYQDELRDLFNITSPNEIQQQALAAIETGNDVMVISQTGSGKSLTFLLPLLQHGGIVVAPNDLLLQQHEHVATMLNASHKIAFATPDSIERLKSESYPTVALDEVDSLLYGGCDDEALTLQGNVIMEYLSRSLPQVICTTAYLSEAHERALKRDFHNATWVQQEAGQLANNWLVPTLRQEFQYFSGDQKLAKLQKVLAREERQGSTLLFAAGVDTVTHIAEAVNEDAAQKRVELLHNELSPIQRSNVIQTLRDGIPTLLVTTDLAARGLDIPNVSHVILYDVPSDVASFVHQVGRTARRGQDGMLTCLVRTQSGEIGQYKQLHALKAASKLSF